jgi:uncharacterized protein (DUF1501 family)
MSAIDGAAPGAERAVRTGARALHAMPAVRRRMHEAAARDPVRERMRAAHATTQLSLRVAATAVSLAPDLLEAEALWLERLKVERRRRLLRDRLAERGATPSTERDGVEVAAALLGGFELRLRRNGAAAALVAALAREIAAYEALEATASASGDRETAAFARTLGEEASNKRPVWPAP